ncbi:MAG: hypothetical protein QNJ57_06595 [Flavobacteriaceae bacterium]|nr:hypothetical protein [Flavobacteriaceae bacterium]
MNRLKKAATVLPVLLILTLFVFNPFNGEAQKRQISYSYNSNKDDDGSTRVRYKDSRNDFKIEFKGDITVSDDDRDIIGISRGGYIEIRRSSFGSSRRIVIETTSSGQLTKSYYVGRKEKNYNTEGKAWLAEILPEILRSTTIAAESRVERFYKRGGADAVLDEIGSMKSDFVQSTYFRLLLRHNLTNNELVSVIRKAGNEIESDYYLSGILEENQKAFLANDRTTDAYIDAAKSIGSDHYASNVLKKVINDASITDVQMGSLLKISKDIGSDHYLSLVLKEVMDKRTLNSQNAMKIISLSSDIQSDHHKSEVLKKLVERKVLSNNGYDAFIGALDDIQSDHYVTEVIKKLLDTKLEDSPGSLGRLLTLVKNNVQSDHYASEIYKRLAKRSLSDDQLMAALETSTAIHSDHYHAEALIALSGRVNSAPDRVKQAYRNAAKSINSTTYYGRALRALD